MGFPSRIDSNRRSAFDMLRVTGVDLDNLAERVQSLPSLSNYDLKIKNRVSTESLYAPYISLQQKAADAFARDESLALPADLDYDSVFGLSIGEREVLKLVRPASVGMARRVEGVTPHGALRLLRFAKRNGRRTTHEDMTLEDQTLQGNVTATV